MHANQASSHDAVFSKKLADYCETWDFTYLHSLVIETHHLNLESTLLNPRHRPLIDTPDVYGRTPLFLLASGADDAKVTGLLVAGVDYSMTDLERRLPFRTAIQSSSVYCPGNPAQTRFQRAYSRQVRQRSFADRNPLG